MVNSKFIMNHLKQNNYFHYFDKGVGEGEGKGKTEMERELSNKIRTQLFKNSGRIWSKQKVISFWLTQDQLTPQILDQTFKSLGVPDKESYFIDVVNPDEMDKEESKQKVLPSYKEYKKRSSSGKLTKDQQKRAAEFISKQHGVAGAQKAKIEPGNIPPVGAEKYA